MREQGGPPNKSSLECNNNPERTLPEIVIRLKVEEEQWRATTKEERGADGQRADVYLPKCYHSSAP